MTAPASPRFATTRWSVVLAAGRGDDRGRAALGELCERYWYPLYSWLRRTGTADDDALDLVQGFLLRLLENEDLHAEPERGRFRSYLLGALRHYVANVDRAARAARRGGGRPVVSLDGAAASARYARESAAARDAEQRFDRQWALAVLERGWAELEREQRERGHGERFAVLRDKLAGDPAALDHTALAARLGVTVSATKVAVHRLRVRLGELIRREVADTVGDPEDVEAELRELFAALG